MLPTRTAVTEWMVQYVVTTLELQREAITPDARFDSYGLDSLEVMVMIGLLEDEFQIEVSADEMQSVPTINGVGAALLQSGKIQEV